MWVEVQLAICFVGSGSKGNDDSRIDLKAKTLRILGNSRHLP